MSAASLLKTPATRAALGVFVVALATVAWTTTRALRPAMLPPVPPAAIGGLDAITHHTTPAFVDVQAAVESDLFSPERTAPSGEYRMPGEAGPDDKPAAEVQRPLVLGTAVATDGRSFATVRLGDGHPTLVHVGDRIGEWVVRNIERGKVTLVSAAGVRADVTVPKPGT